VTRQPAAKLGGYVGLAALLLLAGLTAGRPELVAVAAPLVLLVIVALVSAREPVVTVTAAADTERAVEGDEVTVTLTLTAAVPVSRLEVLLVVPDGLSRASAAELPARAVRLRHGERRTVEVRLRCDHWGAYQLGTVLLRAHDPLRLLRWEWPVRASLPLVVFPQPETLRLLVHPFETQVFTGNQVARQRGDGIEFADVRPFQPGDRARSINWRATARRGVPWVNQRHPERNTDVVLLLDTFADVPAAGTPATRAAIEAAGQPGGTRGTLDRAVGAAASLASAYLARRDRVGLVGFGGVVRWLQPGSGQAALYRLLDTLMETQIFATVGWRNIHQLPPRTLPPKALIVALSPLLDERATAALFDLLARGYDLAVIDVSPLIPSGGDRPATPTRGHSRRRLAMGRRSGTGPALDALALRLWALQRAALRHRYQQLGVPVVEWPPGIPAEQVVYELELPRRRTAARSVPAR